MADRFVLRSVPDSDEWEAFDRDDNRVIDRDTRPALLAPIVDSLNAAVDAINDRWEVAA